MHRRVMTLVILVAVALVGALGAVWVQQNRVHQAELILSKYWSNDFAMVFSKLGTVNQELQQIDASGEIEEEVAVRLDADLSYMTLHLTNELGDVRGYLPDVPHVPYLVGYLDQVRQAVNTHRRLNAPRPLTAGERRAFRQYADLSEKLTDTVKQYYPDYRGDGGFSSDDDYWALGFLSDTRWREMLLRMDAEASEMGFMAR